MSDTDDIAENLASADQHQQEAAEERQRAEERVRALLADCLEVDTEFTIHFNKREYAFEIGVPVEALTEEIFGDLPDDLVMLTSAEFNFEVELQAMIDDPPVPNVRNLRQLISELENGTGAYEPEVIRSAIELGYTNKEAVRDIRKLKQKGEVYEPRTNYLRTT